jgi:hypothetical protein
MIIIKQQVKQKLNIEKWSKWMFIRAGGSFISTLLFLHGAPSYKESQINLMAPTKNPTCRP